MFSHCTKNEEILNGKLHFMCSVILSTTLHLNHDRFVIIIFVSETFSKEKNCDYLGVIQKSTVLVQYRLAFCSGTQKLEYSTPNMLNILLNQNIRLMSVLKSTQLLYHFLDRCQPGAIKSVLLVIIGWLVDWLVRQLSQKWLQGFFWFFAWS